MSSRWLTSVPALSKLAFSSMKLLLPSFKITNSVNWTCSLSKASFTLTKILSYESDELNLNKSTNVSGSSPKLENCWFILSIGKHALVLQIV